MPPYADALRAATHMPVCDAITCFFVRSRMDNPRVGLRVQKEWDGEQAALQAAACTKVASFEEGPGVLVIHTPEYLKAQVPTLGVLRLDFEHERTAGDMAHPDTIPYPVYYRVVPGMTYDMCRTRKMSPQVEQEFINAITYFDDRNVCGITHDCGLAVLFQILSRRCTKRPVFVSPLARLWFVLSGSTS